MTKQATIFSRRRILATLGLGGAAAAAVAAPPLPLSWTRKAAAGNWWDQLAGRPLERGAMDQWRNEVGASFLVDGENGASTLKLVKVEALNSKGRRPSSLGRDRAFAAVFEAEGNAPAGDRTYALAHDTHGSMDVFMTAASRAGSKMRLEAVFN